MLNQNKLIMKKVTLLLLAIFLTGFIANAQSIFQDDFESYSVGDYVAENSTVWTTWSNNPASAEDAVISDAFANSPSQSMHVSGTNDMVLPLGDKTSGNYLIEFYMYVENDGASEGYFNLQHFEAPGNEWAMECYFNLDGTGHLDADGSSYTFDYTQDAWVHVETYVNIDADTAALYIDGTHVQTWPFATVAGGGAGTPQLGGVNIYAGAETGTPNFYMDDVNYEAIQSVLFADDFESYSVADYVAENSDVWTTWSNNPGTAEDAVISDAFANSPSQSMHVSGTNDMVLPLGDQASGQFWVNFYMYVENDGASEGYYNLQHFEAPGNEWAMECYFNLDGTGHLDADGSSYTFDYTQDAWVEVKNYIDIDADTAALYIDGTHVQTWAFATVAGGGAGTPQLGGVNIYAGAETGTPNFYIDDVVYFGSSSAAPPTASVDVTSITTTTGADEMFSLSNVGDQELTWDAYPTYPAAKEYTALPERILPKSNEQPMSALQSVSNPQPTDLPKDGTLTHVQSAFGGGVGYGSPVSVKAASKFRPQDIADFVGMELTSVLVGINDLPGGDTATLMIWGKGEYATPGPGALIYEETFTIPEAGAQVTVDLATPIYLDGNDLWVGYALEDLGDGNFPIGIDGGPRVDGVNWLSTGPGWGQMNPATDGNIFIVCNLVGDGISNWMSVSPNTGTLAADATEDITVSFDPTGLTAGTEYTGQIIVASNTPDNEYIPIDVSYTPGEAYEVTFTVTDGTDPLEGATINVNSTDITTDASGVATISLPDGDYAYTVNLTGYIEATGTFSVSGAATSVDVTLDPDGIKENSQAAFNIYPNPSKGIFNITADGAYEVNIINITGEMIYNNVHENNTVLDLSNHASGIYFLRMKTKNSTTSRKIVIE